MSGIKFLLDTNIVIGLLKGNNKVIQLLEDSACILSESAISQITRVELLSYPKLEKEEEKNIIKFISSISIFMFDEDVEKTTISYRRKKGGKLPDAIILATAVHHRLRLISMDVNMNKRMQSIDI